MEPLLPQQQDVQARIDEESASPIDVMLASSLRQYEDQVKRINALRPYLEVLKDTAQLYGGKVQQRPWTTAVELLLPVKSFREQNLLDILEHLDNLGYPVQSTEDETYGNGARLFKIATGAMISAELPDESDACKKVIVGWTEPSKPYPIYKFECNDGPAGPDLKVVEVPNDLA